MNKKNILVTGGSGFLGYHLINALVSSNYNVRVLDCVTSKRNLPSDIDFRKVDLLDAKGLDDALDGIDIVYHLAAFADLDKANTNPKDTMQINVIGTTNILEAAIHNNLKHIYFSSSIYVDSRTGGFYRVSKHCCELLLEEYYNRYGLEYTILRFGTLYGPSSDGSNSVYSYLREALLKNKINSIGTGDEIREYIDVRDASDVCLKLLDTSSTNETIILTGNHRMKLSDLLEMINEILGNNIDITYGEGKPAHYKYTPYSYKPALGKKIVMDSYRDLGQGLLEILEEIDTE